MKHGGACTSPHISSLRSALRKAVRQLDKHRPNKHRRLNKHRLAPPLQASKEWEVMHGGSPPVQFLHFEPSLDASSLQSDFISSISHISPGLERVGGEARGGARAQVPPAVL